MKRFLLLCLLFLNSAYSRTKLLEFSTQKLSDSVSLHVGGIDEGNQSNDTLIISTKGKDSLTIFPFTGQAINAFCDGVRSQVGLAFYSSRGIVGKGGQDDSIWGNVVEFPDSVTRLDSVPYWGFRLSREQPVEPNYVGITMGSSTNFQGICTYPIWSISNGFNQIIYFKSGGTFGKVQIIAYGDTITTAFWGGELKSYNRIFIQYLFSTNRLDLNAPAISIRKPNKKIPSILQKLSKSLRDILGRKYKLH